MPFAYIRLRVQEYLSFKQAKTSGPHQPIHWLRDPPQLSLLDDLGFPINRAPAIRTDDTSNALATIGLLKKLTIAALLRTFRRRSIIDRLFG